MYAFAEPSLSFWRRDARCDDDDDPDAAAEEAGAAIGCDDEAALSLLDPTWVCSSRDAVDGARPLRRCWLCVDACDDCEGDAGGAIWVERRWAGVCGRMR